jgi:UDP-N-acetylmuramoylalanine--D-glutamate ligase
MNNSSEFFPDLNGKRVTVMGLGLFGGGVAATRFLADRGARVTVTDLLSENELAESLAQLNGCPIANYHLGGHVEEDFTDADLIVVNPAVKRCHRFLQQARQAGIPLSSEMNLFWQFNRGKTIGVTGSNGKSTTTALIHSILQAAGWNSRLGGNIGCSLLSEVETIQIGDWSVLEFSSFQLHDLDRLPASPDVAVVTNFAPNHLDWHESLDDYRKSKQTILRWQSPQAIAVLNQDDDDVNHWPVFGRTFWFGSHDQGREGIFLSGNSCLMRLEGTESLISLPCWLKLPGLHNLQNAMAAACVALALGVPVDALQQGMEDFTPLPHRLQFVAEVEGRRFYNDSLATTPESAIAAVESFAAPVILLAGGYDKQVDLSQLAETIATRVKAAALMGQTAEELTDLLEYREINCTVSSCECSSFEEAFRCACAHSAPGDVILLSPGCASYDWFANFQERGETFIELVHAWHPEHVQR